MACPTQSHMITFQLHGPFKPHGDQPQAIRALTQGVLDGVPAQTLLGVTGSGKTFTIANVIANVQRPTLVLAHNKTLAAQLYQEFKEFFPHNAVEYFVSYYDYYQPEAYIARSDTFIEKSLLINDEIDKLRLSATRSLLERRDTIVVSSVSCIYGIGAPDHYAAMSLQLVVGQQYIRSQLLNKLVQMRYIASSVPQRSTFRATGSVIDIFPAYEDSLAIRLEFDDHQLENIYSLDPITMRIIDPHISQWTLYPGSHYVSPEHIRTRAIESIKLELTERLPYFAERPIEYDRLYERTHRDLEMIQEVGFCKGIENYSRHFSGLPAGAPPACLLDYFPEDFLLVVDESHQTLPQIKAMYHGDRSRKQSLVEYGFRLPSAFDNRPLSYEEARKYFRTVIYVSATPGEIELRESQDHVIQQILRPTGIPDPIPEVRPATGQIDDLLEEIRITRSSPSNRILIISLTKKLAEDISAFLTNLHIPNAYLHAEIETAERTKILSDLRSGKIDVLIGVNLLREGLDLPEVALIAILDADKEGFLRNTTSLVQFCGRAARNIHGRVILYADHITSSIQETINIASQHHEKQVRYNQEHNLTPKPIIKGIFANPIPDKQDEAPTQDAPIYSKEELENLIVCHKKLMIKASNNYQFQEAAHHRDLVFQYQQQLMKESFNS